MKVLFLALLFLSSIVQALDGVPVTVDNEPTLCNNGSIEKDFAGTLTTTCGAGWSVGALPEVPEVSASPLHFSDLISCPATGLGDGATNGTQSSSGCIVTVWGQNLGSSQGSSTITFTDSEGTERIPYVYYWKNADGTLPSGPANLYESHGMQEIAFSIPAGSALGAGTIKTTVAGEVSTLPFTVRTGDIYHVKSTGSDTNDGSFASPWLTVAKATSTAPAGSTIYVHDVDTGHHLDTDMVLYHNNSSSNSSLAAQYAYVAYPNNQPEAIGRRGFNNYFNDTTGITGLVISKYSIFAADSDTDANDLPTNQRSGGTYGIRGSVDGRAVANYITDEHSSDPNGACPDSTSAAIVANTLQGDRVSNWKIFGNEIENYGCAGTNKQHHTTYLSIRGGDANPQVVSPEMAFNYLKNNRASGGLHVYDENIGGTNCGNFTTEFKVHNNVVVDQSGPGIANYFACPVTTQFTYYNNLLINTGYYDSRNDLLSSPTAKQTNFEAVYIGQGEGVEAGTQELTFYNNTIIKWNDQDVTGTVDACIGFHSNGENPATITINWSGNVCLTDKDKRFIQSDNNGTSLESAISGETNAWYTSAATQTLAVPPTWDATKVTTDPLLTYTGVDLTIAAESPLKSKITTDALSDYLGTVRTSPSTIGAKQ